MEKKNQFYLFNEFKSIEKENAFRFEVREEKLGVWGLNVFSIAVNYVWFVMILSNGEEDRNIPLNERLY